MKMDDSSFGFTRIGNSGCGDEPSVESGTICTGEGDVLELEIRVFRGAVTDAIRIIERSGDAPGQTD